MYWLLKSEPEDYSWQHLCQDGYTTWDGVRNYQAQNNLKQMRIGEQAFFYHSGKERAIVGIVRIMEGFKPEPKVPEWGVVTVVPLKTLQRSIPLSLIKQESNLKGLSILRQPRLSVAPIFQEEWNAILKL